MSDAAPEPGGGAPLPPAPARSAMRRLHPITIVVEIPGLLIRWIWPLALLWLVKSDDAPEPGEANGPLVRLITYATTGVVLAFVQSLVRYVSTRYSVAGGRLVLRTGILSRRQRVIPLDQVQNIDVQQKPLQRLFRVCEVRIETAGGRGTEARLAVVSLPDAHEFRRDVLAGRSPAAVAAAGDAAGDAGEWTIRKATWGDLFLAGATENRIGPIIGGLFAVSELLEDTGFDVQNQLERASDALVGGGPLATTVAIAASAVLLVLCGWVVSIVLTIVTYHGFTLRRTRDGLRRSHGLFSRFEALLHVRRIQVILVEANPLRRLLGRAMLRVQTAGSPQNGRSGGSSVLFPLVPRGEILPLVRLVHPNADVDESRLRPVHRLAIRRGFYRYALALLGAFAGLALGVRARDPWWLAWVPLLLLVAWRLGHARWRALGYELSDEFLLTRAGVWTRRLWIVPKNRVQTVALRQSPFQRRLGLATLTIDTAGAASWSATRIVDLGLDEARRVFEDLVRGAAATTWDGGGVRRRLRRRVRRSA